MNIRNIRIVKLYDTFYAIRKGWIYKEYLNLSTTPVLSWYRKGNTKFDKCVYRDLKFVE